MEARIAVRPRAFVRAVGPDAADYLQRMLSNDVVALGLGESCEALLLTPKARIIATMHVLRRGPDDFLLATEPELGERLRAELLRMRFAAKVEVEPEEHESFLLLGAPPPAGAAALRNDDYGVSAWEVLDAPRPDVPELPAEELEALRIRAGSPRFGHELDERVLPAEAGLVPRAVSLAKGCYPGQEPVARLHYRGHANRGLRALRVESDEVPPYDAELTLGEKVVGRVTSAAHENGAVVALAYVRAEVPVEAELRVGDAVARPLH